MKTRGIILAAGRGSRMGDKTKLKPKCLNKIDGKTLLDWQLDSMSKSNISNLILVTGYKSKMLQGNFKKIKNIRWNETNMVSSLFCAPSFDGNTIVSYSDIVYKPDYINLLENSIYDVVITADKSWKELWSLRFKNPLDDAETFKCEENYLTEIGSKTDDINNIQGQYMGLLKFSNFGWKITKNIYMSFPKEKRDKMDMTSLLNELIRNKIKIKVIFVSGGWCEADTYNDILVYEEQLKKDFNWKFNWKIK